MNDAYQFLQKEKIYYLTIITLLLDIWLNFYDQVESSLMNYL